jgi:acetate kinase
LPKNLEFRRYGFQGTSHQYAAGFAKKAKKVITVHLGGGASVTAIKNGKAIDTSMGYTPLEGLVMMTRSGNVDAGIVLQLVKEYGIEGADKLLNKDSGIKGICGEADFLKVLAKIKQGDKAAKLAFDVFVYSVQKYIGAYFAILGGCDMLIFTGSIGAGNPKTRNAISKMDILKKTKILAIKTDEELAIAQKILKIK